MDKNRWSDEKDEIDDRAKHFCYGFFCALILVLTMYAGSGV